MYRTCQLYQLYIEPHRIKVIPFVGSFTMLFICSCTSEKKTTTILQVDAYTQEATTFPLDSVYGTSQSLTKVSFANKEDDPLLVNLPRMIVLMK